MTTEQTQSKPRLSLSGGTGFFKSRRCLRRQEIFVAWATLIPMTSAGPVEEPAEPLWFDFGTTADEAEHKVMACVEREIGIDEWIRQVA